MQVTIYGPFHQLLPMANMPVKGALTDDQLLILSQAGIAFAGDTILAVGKFEQLVGQFSHANVHEITTPSVCLPGFIDCHTHICHGGSRARDFALRNAGTSYLEIAKQGGGIWDTVTQTRKLNIHELASGIIDRANYMRTLGISTIEVKSGYGLSVEHELDMLRAIQLANKHTAQELIPTCLAAHILPKDFKGNHQAYLNYISQELFPILQQEKLSSRIDIFVEEEAFSQQMAIDYLQKAKSFGFECTVHADQFTTGGSQVATTVEAVSADHLEVSTTQEINMLSKSNTTAVALPGASMGLGMPFTPARQLLDAGASVAIASDWNPGSAPQGNLLNQASILATYQKLSNAEVLSGITNRAAHALRKSTIGQLKPSYKANFVIFETSNYQEITYQQGRLTPSKTVIHGQ